MIKTVKEIIACSYQTDGILLNAMHEAQNHCGYLTGEAVTALADTFQLSKTEVVSMITFYGMFRMVPPAPVCIQICKSAPCHVAGAGAVIAALEAELGIRMGETTADGQYQLAYVECLGQCQASPALLVNGRLYAGVTPGQVKALLREGVE